MKEIKSTLNGITKAEYRYVRDRITKFNGFRRSAFVSAGVTVLGERHDPDLIDIQISRYNNTSFGIRDGFNERRMGWINSDWKRLTKDAK